MAVTKEEIDSDGEVRYYGEVSSVSEVADLYTAEERSSMLIMSIRDAALTDTAGVAAFPNVTRLTLANHKITSVQELAHLKDLDDLDLSENEIARVSGLANAPLTVLNLSTNLIESLADFDGPPTLKQLTVNSCKISSIASLSDYPNLRSLQIIDNAIETLDVDGVSSLTSLEARQNPLRTTAGLEAFPHLKTLIVGDDIRVVEGLENCPDLTKIEIHGPIDEIHPASLEVLVALKKSGGKVSFYGSEDVFARYPQLKLPPKVEPRNGSLKYRGEPLSIAGLAGLYDADELKSVTNLSLTACYLTDTDGLEAFTEVASINLETNSLVSVTGLGALHSLTSLNLAQNKITAVSDIEPSTTLETLSLERNEVESIKGLAAFTNLRELNLDRNPKLSDLDPGGRMESLVELTLYQCAVPSLEGMTGFFPNLKTLKLKETGVKHITGLDGFGHLKHLELDDDVETFDEASVQKIVEMRAAGHRVTIGFSRTAPDRLLKAYPALGEQ